MSWLATLFIAFLNAVIGLFAAGFIANCSVSWYHMSGREGASGYFVVAMALLGGVVAGIIGLIACRVVAGGAEPNFLKGFGSSVGIALVTAGLVMGIAHALADIPPTLDGESLVLAVEVRWPEDQKTSPALESGECSLALHSIPRFSHTVRASVHGPLWKEDAHLAEGRWVAPGALEIFTQRGRRAVEVSLGDKPKEGFLISLSGRPGKQDLAWSDWLPRARTDGTLLTNRMSIRYRVQRGDAPVRTEQVGPFEVVTVAAQFNEVQVGSKTVIDPVGYFLLRYGGQPLVFKGQTSVTDSGVATFDRVLRVATIAGTRSTLLVSAAAHEGDASNVYLLTEREGVVRADYVSASGYQSEGRLLTSDQALFVAANKPELLRGQIDREHYRQPGLYLFNAAIVDTRTHAVYHYKNSSELMPIPSVPALALSPDEKSFVWYAYAENSSAKPVLAVTHFVSDQTYAVGLDRERMRFARMEQLTPLWLAHHFTWAKGSDGSDKLVVRTDFTPLPFQGELRVEGESNGFWIEPALPALRPALIELLKRDFKADVSSDDPNAYEQTITIEGQAVQVACSADSEYVLISLPAAAAKPDLMARLAQRINAALATGQYDALFVSGPRKYEH